MPKSPPTLHVDVLNDYDCFEVKCAYIYSKNALNLSHRTLERGFTPSMKTAWTECVSVLYSTLLLYLCEDGTCTRSDLDLPFQIRSLPLGKVLANCISGQTAKAHSLCSLIGQAWIVRPKMPLEEVGKIMTGYSQGNLLGFQLHNRWLQKSVLRQDLAYTMTSFEIRVIMWRQFFALHRAFSTHLEVFDLVASSSLPARFLAAILSYMPVHSIVIVPGRKPNNFMASKAFDCHQETLMRVDS